MENSVRIPILRGGKINGKVKYPERVIIEPGTYYYEGERK